MAPTVGIPYRTLRRPRRGERPRRRPLLQRDPRRPRLGPLRWPSAWPWARRPVPPPRWPSPAIGRPARRRRRPACAIGCAATARSSTSSRRPQAVASMTFVRTVLGDIDPRELGRDLRPRAPRHRRRPAGPHGAGLRPRPTSTRWRPRSAPRPSSGCGAVVDAMPCDAGRNAVEARRAVAPDRASTSSPRPGSTTTATTGRPTGAHRLGVDELADLFVADIAEGIDANDYCGTGRRADAAPRRRHQGRRLRRWPVRPRPADLRGGGPAPIAGPARRSSPTARRGTGALEQVRLLADHGVDAGHVALSHVDKVVDRGYHRELAATGAFVEYDGSFRWGDAPNGTLQLLEWAAEDGRLGPGRARAWTPRGSGYYARVRWLARADLAARRVHGGDGGARPGRTTSGAGCSSTNPARAFAFATVDREGCA